MGRFARSRQGERPNDLQIVRWGQGHCSGCVFTRLVAVPEVRFPQGSIYFPQRRGFFAIVAFRRCDRLPRELPRFSEPAIVALCIGCPSIAACPPSSGRAAANAILVLPFCRLHLSAVASVALEKGDSVTSSVQVRSLGLLTDGFFIRRLSLVQPIRKRVIIHQVAK